MKSISQILLGVSVFFLSLTSTFAAGITISPLKFEMTVQPGVQKSDVIKLTNNTDGPITLYSSKEDFVAGDETGRPKFVASKDQTSETYSLANWIRIENENLTLAKGETREVRFTVQAPANAEPGGHYGAVFFSPGVAGQSQVSVVQRLGVLLLVNVPGNVEVRGEMTKFTAGTKDDKEVFSESSSFDAFPIDFQTQFENAGNTHLKPLGKIELVDENGEILKNVGKETIVNDKGAFAGEKMVDYLPINDTFGNVLPKSKRTFDSVWQGFGYQELQEDGTKLVKFKDLTQYYADKTKQTYLQFWQSVHTRSVDKKITANLSLSYEGKDGQKKDFKEAKTFSVRYDEQYVGMNYWMILLVLLIIASGFYYVKVAAPKSRERLKKQLLEEMKK